MIMTIHESEIVVALSRIGNCQLTDMKLQRLRLLVHFILINIATSALLLSQCLV